MVPCDNNLTPIHHSEISISLHDFCFKWNNNLSNYLSLNQTEKISLIAQYHHDFRVIHPFVDGNGRIGRVILKDMVLYLLNKTITFEYDIADYYAAKSNEKP